MDDLIKRQDAIDVIKEFKNGAAEWRDEQEERSDIWHRADSAIASALEIGLRVKKIPSAQRWIPCSERLPKDDKLKWLTFFQYDKRTLDVYVGFYDQEEKAWCEPTYGNRYAENITAWMDIPKPEPYKGENAND